MSKKKILYNALTIVLIAVGFIGGMQVESHASEKREDKCTIKTIAVVNLDEGISIDGTLVNYATQLMQFPDVNFVVAGLEEARSGVRKNQFAAYITIPSDFSKSTVSINEKPEKAVVTYRMNTKLREDIQVEVMQDVNNFLLTLSNNLSYMYIDAILNEFHTAQDNAQTVIENDNKDMQNITAVDSNSLIEPTEFSEIQQVDSTVEKVDFEKEYQTADQIVKGITATYESNVQQGVDEFKTVKEGETAVTAAIEQTLTGMGNIDIEKNEDGQPVYQGGIDAISEHIDGYQNEYNTKKTYAKALAGANIDISIEDIETLPNKIDQVCDKIDVSNTNIKEEIDSIQKLLEDGESDEEEDEESEGEEDGKSDEETDEESDEEVDGESDEEVDGESDEEVDGESDEEAEEESDEEAEEEPDEEAEEESDEEAEEETEEAGEESNDNKEKIKEHLDTIQSTLLSKDEIKNDLSNKAEEIISAVDEIPIMETKDFSGIIEDKIVKPIQDKCISKTEAIKGNTDNVKTQMDTYQTALNEFDPYKYLDKNNISTSLANLQSNLDNMQQKIDTSNQEYQNYTQEVYENANENVAQLQQDMQKASESTSLNVVNVIDEAKNKRTQINKQNVEMLFNLTQKLPYTRLGSVEYTESYDFIVSPIKVEGN